MGTGTTSLVQTFDSGITGDAIPTISELVYGELGTELLVSLNDGIRGTSLWETDGSGAGTQFLSPVDPTSIAVFDGTAYFLGTGGGSSYGLWKTNGTAVGTTEVMDLSSYGQAPEDYDPQGDLVTSGSHLFFITGDSKGGVDVWSSDGTSQGTGVVRDFAQSPGSSAGPSILELTPFDTSLAFVLKADSGAQAWITDGTAGGTQLLTDLSLPGTGNSYVTPYSLTVAGGHMYFISATPGETSGTVGLWLTKGTPASTAEIFSFSTLANSEPSQPAVVPTVTDLTAFGSILYVSLEYGQQTNGGSGMNTSSGPATGPRPGRRKSPWRPPVHPSRISPASWSWGASCSSRRRTTPASRACGRPTGRPAGRRSCRCWINR